MAAKKKVGGRSTAAKARASKTVKKTKAAVKARGAGGKGAKKKIEGATAMKSPRNIAKKLTVASRGRRKPVVASAPAKGKKSAVRSRGAAKSAAKKVAKSQVAQSVLPVSKVAKPTKKTRTKSDVVGVLSLATSLSRKEVKSVMEALNELVAYDLSNKGPGDFRLNDLVKISYVKKKATKSRKGTSPFTGEPMTFKAKPSRSYVKVRVLKSLKNMV